jgi:hypothetical protein
MIYYTKHQKQEGDDMSGKMLDTRFTIQFSQTDPAHLKVADILNQQGRRSKAQYIVNAIIHYTNCKETPNTQRSAELDEKHIETIVCRILQDKLPALASLNQTEALQSTEDINADDIIGSFGENGLNAIAGAMDMFKKNKNI